MLLAILHLLTVLSISALSGLNDAVLYSRRGADAFPWNEHKIFVAKRAALILLVALTCLLTLNGTILPLAVNMIIIYPLSYPFVHNSIYYEARNRIDKSYPAGWKSDSTTSTAQINFNLSQRTGMALLSLLIFIITLTAAC